MFSFNFVSAWPQFELSFVSALSQFCLFFLLNFVFVLSPFVSVLFQFCQFGLNFCSVLSFYLSFVSYKKALNLLDTEKFGFESRVMLNPKLAHTSSPFGRQTEKVCIA